MAGLTNEAMSFKLDRRGREIAALCLLALALLLVLSLVTYHSSDPTLFTTSSGQRPVRNVVGIFGANLAAILLVATGVSAYWLPVFLVGGALRFLLPSSTLRPLPLAIGCILLI
ncbi:MAG: DNA translocase FtsK 4TM domain-containing protein, partial [Syntrophobacterales bacterium]